MSSLTFPDRNVWLALATSEHIHSGLARRWWEGENGVIAFSRFTQLGLLRLMTTAAAMDGKPLTLAAAWRVYDRFFEDDRVAFVPEPVGTEERFRELTKGKSASPKLWADAWLLALSHAAGGALVTFDKALGSRGAYCLLAK
jgi:uncharacterized protein